MESWLPMLQTCTIFLQYISSKRKNSQSFLPICEKINYKRKILRKHTEGEKKNFSNAYQALRTQPPDIKPDKHF